ncbi:MAG: hypothetical protein JWP58_3787 [Hymenobacter sp.]|nr:hypothetical protein [Hymenobacter sp.]
MLRCALHDGLVFSKISGQKYGFSEAQNPYFWRYSPWCSAVNPSELFAADTNRAAISWGCQFAAPRSISTDAPLAWAGRGVCAG